VTPNATSRIKIVASLQRDGEAQRWAETGPLRLASRVGEGLRSADVALDDPAAKAKAYCDDVKGSFNQGDQRVRGTGRDLPGIA